MYCSFIWKPQALRKTQWFPKLGSLSHRPTPPGPRLRFAAARLRPMALGFASWLSGCPCQDKTHPSSYRPQRVSVPLAVTHRTQPLAGGPMGDGSKNFKGGKAPLRTAKRGGALGIRQQGFRPSGSRKVPGFTDRGSAGWGPPPPWSQVGRKPTHVFVLPLAAGMRGACLNGRPGHP